ncbi:magnesium/cobalt transporter CorA [Ruficoccus sp. ZRK36]|uniref:magnesium/cobalt transporter CorA n=1 Tax=Ruficoccus sp. ZRK36 TaxID=2866311 RepID=UPI001C72B252|nr:magnesium/cobalt transporter CorA [Ruficoccus sp. ZRK36]QYY34775.1 magnesium/cobalt transporter CorA [Ruficoccus sp. ZRK36]
MKVVWRKKVFDQGHGLPPGQLVRVAGDLAATKPSIHLLAYSEDDFMELENATLDQVREQMGKWKVVWIHVCGVSDEALIRGLGEMLSIHALAQEEILNTSMRPKFEEYGRDLFVLTKTATVNRQAREIMIEQMAFYATEHALLSVQESETSFFQPVMARVREPSARLRVRGSGYLLFALMDMKADNILSILDMIETDIVEVEEDLLSEDEDFTIDTIYQHKRTVLAIMRFVMPMRDNAHRLEIIDHPLVHDEDRYFFRDLADNARRAADRLEHARLILQNMQEYYHLMEEHRNNHVMKVLTIIATLFLPLTFIAGVYGMNFDHEISPWNMPELYSYYGYPLCMLFMAGFFVAMLWWFRRMKWL